MTTQPEALLADWLADYARTPGNAGVPDIKLNEAANAIRALLASIQDMERQHEAARKTLEGIGYTSNGGQLWKPPIGSSPNWRLIDQKNARIAELEQQISTHPAEQDAARYRWMRSHPEFFGVVMELTGLLTADHAEADAEIDAAIAKPGTLPAVACDAVKSKQGG